CRSGSTASGSCRRRRRAAEVVDESSTRVDNLFTAGSSTIRDHYATPGHIACNTTRHDDEQDEEAEGVPRDDALARRAGAGRGAGALASGRLLQVGCDGGGVLPADQHELTRG